MRFPLVPHPSGMTHVHARAAILLIAVLPLIGVLVYVGVHGTLIQDRREHEILAQDAHFAQAAPAPNSSSRICVAAA
jgi:hypothetical protein